MPRLLLTLAVLAPLLLAGCAEEPERPPVPRNPALAQRPEVIPFRKDGTLTFYRPTGEEIVTLDIEIAEGDSAITRGLMQRDSLPERGGMLFLMPQTRIQSFWMANTPLSLDITFVGPDSAVVNTAKYTRPYSTASVSSEAPARFVVETRAGFADRHGIVAGDRIRWQRGQPDA